MRNFPDDPARFQHFVPDDGAKYARYLGLNPDPEGKRDRAELCALVKDEKGELRSTNEVVQGMNLFQVSIWARLTQIEGNSAWEKLHGGRPVDFDRSPATFAKVVQRLLVHPRDRIFVSRSMSMEEVLPAIIIAPEFITPTLIRNLGLENPVQEKGLLLEDQATLRAGLIDEIKASLDSLKAIRRPDEMHQSLGDLRYFRLMRIADGKNEGMVIGTQVIGGQTILFQTDLPGAERRLFHIHENYKEEIRKLKFIQKVATELRSHMDYWSNPKRRTAATLLLGTVATVVDSLEHVTDEAKVGVKKQLSECLTFEDSLGRPNPSSKQARLITVLNYLGERLCTIEGVSRYLGVDHKKVLQTAAGQVDLLGDVKAMMDDRRPWEEQTDHFEQAEDQVVFQPDLGFAREAKAKVATVSTQLAEGDKASARKTYVELYVVCKMKEAHSGIWDIYRRISLFPDQTRPAQVLEELNAIESRLRDKSFAQGIEVESYYVGFKRLYHLINSLKKRLEEHLGLRSETTSMSEANAKQERGTATTKESPPVDNEAENQNLVGILKGVQGKSLSLDALLRRLSRDPQMNLLALIAGSDRQKRLKTYDAMKIRIADVCLDRKLISS